MCMCLCVVCRVCLCGWVGVGGLVSVCEQGKGMGAFDLQRLVFAGRILGNEETLLASGVAKTPQVYSNMQAV